MAAVTKAYLLEGTSISTRGAAALECTDSFLVEGIATGAGALWSAVTATGLPGIWSPHPIIPNLNAVSYSPSFKGTGKAVVTVRYVNTNPVLIVRGGVGLVGVQRDTDVGNVPILVSNVNPNALPSSNGVTFPAVPANMAKVEGGTISDLHCQGTVCVERIRPGLSYGGIDPRAQATAYAGCINSTTFMGVPPACALCENVGFDCDGFEGVAWRMTYEFRFDRKTFHPRIAWTDRETGQPGANLLKAPGYDEGIPWDAADTSYGRKVVRGAEVANLNDLLV